MSHVLILKRDPFRRLISFLSGFLQIFSCGGHAEDTTAVGDDLAVFVEFCARVEDIVIVFSLELLKSLDRESFFILYRVAVGRSDHTYCRAVIVEL